MAIQAFRGAVINLFPASEYDTAIEIEYSYSTRLQDEIGDVPLDLPDLAVEAIIAGTLAEILAMPGEGQNLPLAAAKKSEYEVLKSQLRALGSMGYGPAFWKAPSLNTSRPYSGYGYAFTGGWS